MSRKLLRQQTYLKKKGLNNEGIVLYIVLATIFISVILINVILTIMYNQTRFVQHKFSRIRGYYAAQAGINYALENIRINRNTWLPSPAVPGNPAVMNKFLCANVALGGGCANTQNSGLSYNVTITIGPLTTDGRGLYPISATVDYSNVVS